MSETKPPEQNVTQAKSDQVTKEAAKGPQYFVDGKSVSLDEYLKAAEKSGWNTDQMRTRNAFPPISTKNHGEK